MFLTQFPVPDKDLRGKIGDKQWAVIHKQGTKTELKSVTVMLILF